MVRPPSAPRLTPRPPGQVAPRGDAAPDDEFDDDGFVDGFDDGFDDDVHDDAVDTQALDLLAPGGTSEHGGPRRRPRVLEPEVAPERSPLVGELVRGGRAGLESVILSWLLVTVPVVAAYVATVASPVLGEASWFDAARSASAGWLLGLGQELTVTGADGAVSTVTLAPLALTLVTAGLLAGRIRRARLSGPWPHATAGAVALAAIAAVYAVAQSSPSVRAVVTTLAVVGGSVLLGAARSGALPAPPSTPVAAAVVAGLRAGWRAAVALLVLGAVTVVVLLVARATAVVQLQEALGADPLGAGVLVVAQALALPTLAVWVTAWWLGPGFSVGLVNVTPTSVGEGPLPVVPVLAAVPESGPGPGVWVVLVPVLLLTAVLVGSLRRGTAGRRDQVLTLTTAVLTTAVLAGVAAGLSGGAAGAAVGPLTAVGTSTLPVTLAAAWVAAVAAALAWLTLTGARRLDLVGRVPVLGEVVAAGRRLGAGARSLPGLRRLSRRRRTSR